MKKVVILSTGGTIASIENEKTGLLSSGSLSGEKLVFIKELSLDVEVEVETIFQIPSNHMSFKKLIKLRNKISSVLKQENVKGVVITHGTDTLEETAYFLDLTIASKKPIVVTGSQRGPTELGTDAFVNIRQSVLVAANPESKNMGTVVLFNEKFFFSTLCKKSPFL